MLKSLFATCLTVLSVNTQPLAVSRPNAPSIAFDDIDTPDNTVVLPTDIIRLSNGAYADIQYQYASNTIDNTSYDTVRSSLIDGNIYQFVFSIPYEANLSQPLYKTIYTGNFFLGFSSCVNAIVSVYNENYSTRRLEGRTYYHDDNSSLFYSNYGHDLLYRSTDTAGFADVVVTVVASFPSYDDFHFEDFNLVVNECPKQYIPYNVIAIHQSENLYNIFYDFFFGMFDNTGLTEYELELMGVNTTFASWLAHTFTIITFVLLFVVAIIFLRWLFRVVSGLVLIKH